MQELKTISLFTEGRFQYTVTGAVALVIDPTIANWTGEWAPGRLDDSWWMYGGVARKRPKCPAYLEGMTLVGVPPGSTVVIDGANYPISEGGRLELEFERPGTYEVRVIRWPYLPGDFTVEATTHE